ncbi:MAG TPA: hypothetical protein VIF43_00650 [Patescibacteria group bacterium]
MSLIATDRVRLEDAIRQAFRQAESGWVTPLGPGDICDSSTLVCGMRWDESHGLLDLRNLLFEEFANELIQNGEAEKLARRHPFRSHEFKSPQDGVALYLTWRAPAFSPSATGHLEFSIGPVGGLPSYYGQPTETH